jgi:ClpX C4-type zinc finger
MSAMDEPEKPAKPDPRFRGYCSFCWKSYRDAGPLAEGPDNVFICYRCVLLCKDLIENECRRRGVELPT